MIVSFVPVTVTLGVILTLSGNDIGGTVSIVQWARNLKQSSKKSQKQTLAGQQGERRLDIYPGYVMIL